MKDIYFDSENEIDPTAIIGPDVTIGKGNKIGAYVVITGRVIIGNDNYISPFVCIGEPGEYRDRTGNGTVIIGNNNKIREFVAIQGPVLTDKTSIGDNCMIMHGCHVSHDNCIEDDVTIAPLTSFGGMVQIFEGATLGQHVVIHPRLKVGKYAMIGMNATVTKDVPEFETWVGSPAKFMKINEKGKQRYEDKYHHSV